MAPVRDSNRPRIGFIGTGIMGGPMAAHLVSAGFEVTAWNRTIERARALANKGVRAAGRAGDVAEGADVVISMLDTGETNDSILFQGEGAVARRMTSGARLVVMSSIPVETARVQAARAEALGLGYLDAPVSGGEVGARAASLSIMAGGSASDFERVRPVLEAMGRPVLVGPAGSGQLCKLVNQLIVACNIASLAEALTFAEKGGADPALVLQALGGGFADSTVLRLHGRRMVTGDFTPGGPARYQLKDTRTAKVLARTLGLELPVLELVDRLFERMVDAGDGDLDHSAVIRQVRRQVELCPAH